MHLIILGALPPPRGGVTTHIERLIPYLEEAGIKYDVLDHSKVHKKRECIFSLRKQPIKALICLMQPGIKVLHCPLSTITASKLIFLLFIKAIGIKLTITFVASPEQTMENSFLKLFYILALVRFSSHIIVANRDFQRLLVGKGISKNKISVASAFISSKNVSIAEQSLSQEARKFCINCKPVVITYAYGPDLYKGEDLYGLDLIVQLAQELRPELPQIGFIVVIPEITNEDYFRKIKSEVLKSDLDSLFYFGIGNDFSFIPFLQFADLFIRATNTDGDALTLREALYCGVPSVASDVCYRPEGTILFRNRNIADLNKVVRKVLYSNRTIHHKTDAERINNAQLFIDIFKRTAGLRN